MFYFIAYAASPQECLSLPITILSLLVAIFTGYARYLDYGDPTWMPSQSPTAPQTAYSALRRAVVVQLRRIAAWVATAIAKGLDLQVVRVSELERDRLSQQTAIAAQMTLAATAQMQQQALEEMRFRLQAMEDQLIQAEKLAGLGQLIAAVAHDINNPIGFIYGNLVFAEQYAQELITLLEVYQRRCCPAEASPIQADVTPANLAAIQQDLPEVLASMYVGIDRIQNIAKSLTNYARLDIDKAPTDINSAIEMTLRLLRHRLTRTLPHQHPIVLTTAYGNLPRVNCSQGQIDQVVMNIVSNAIDALHDSPAQVCPTIHIETAQIAPNWIRITISDNGAGMSPAIQAKMYEPFFTTKPLGKGTGLGLAISHKIVVDRHHGRLHSQSSPAGTTFQIDLPIQPVAISV